MSGVSGSEDEHADADVKELSVRLKLEKVDNQWAPPLYAEEPTLLLDLDNPVPITRKRFEEFYGLCNKGPSLKRLKIGRDVTEAEVEQFFGPCNGKNSYRYNYHEDEAVIKEVERLWMICHQRTVLPSNRSINKAEARGFALWKRDPSVPVNWCVFGEWTVRDRIRRLQRVEAKKLGGFGGSEGGRGEQSFETAGPTLSPKHEVKNSDDEVPRVYSSEMPPASVRNRAACDDTILEWTEFLGAVENELAASDAGMKAVSERRERCGQELLRYTGQLTDRQQLLEGASGKLAQIEADLAVLKAEVLNTPEVSYESLPNAGPLLRSFHSHVDMVQTFTEMVEKSERDHAKAARENDATEMEWDDFRSRNNVLAKQRVEVQSQLRLLKLGYELPALHPRPPRFTSSGSADFGDCCVISHPCSYCLSPFAPAWNCIVSSCKHGYHSWCAKSWFANNRKCCFPGCREEMHSAWWALFGLQKPHSPEEETKQFEGILDGQDPSTPSTSASIQQTLRPIRSGTLSPSVGSKVVDVKTNSLGPLKSTSPNKKRKEVGQVPGSSDHTGALHPGSEKKRKGTVKKCLSPTVEAHESQSEEASSDGSDDEESSEHECEQLSPSLTEPASGKRSEHEREQLSPSLTETASGKRKSMGGGSGRETNRAVNKKNSCARSSERKEDTSSRDLQLHGAAGSRERKTSTSPSERLHGSAAAEKTGRSGRKGKTPVSERVSMARTTRNAATKSKH